MKSVEREDETLISDVLRSYSTETSPGDSNDACAAFSHLLPTKGPSCHPPVARAALYFVCYPPVYSARFILHAHDQRLGSQQNIPPISKPSEPHVDAQEPYADNGCSASVTERLREVVDQHLASFCSLEVEACVTVVFRIARKAVVAIWKFGVGLFWCNR